MKKILLHLILISTLVYAQEDRVVQNPTKEFQEELDKRLKVFTKNAIKSFPDVKKRFENEFMDGDALYITVKISEGNAFEQFYILTKKIDKDTIFGTVVSDIRSLKKVKKGDSLQIKVKDIIDWCIILKGGKEEGNYSGRYIELFNDRFLPLVYSLEKNKDKKLINPKFLGSFSKQGQNADFVLNDKIKKKAAELILKKQSILTETKEHGIIAVIHYDLYQYKLGTIKELDKKDVEQKK